MNTNTLSELIGQKGDAATKKINALLLKLPFKKIIAAYTIAALAATVICLAAVGFVFRDNVALAWQSQRIATALHKGNYGQAKGEIKALAAGDRRVVDIVAINGGGTVIAAAKSSPLAAGDFKLVARAGHEDFWQLEDRPDPLFWRLDPARFFVAAVTGDEIVAHARKHDPGFAGKTVLYLCNLGKGESDGNLYLIANMIERTGGRELLIVIVFVILFFTVASAILTGLWGYCQAFKDDFSPFFWGLFLLITNSIGVVIYKLYQRLRRPKGDAAKSS